ncbi:MAG: sulfite exporter TauE/SafE family protein [Deltaproteobacteria bacterium]|nr:sulfite exporter TauE/SafE family protein [Deltaproteobacteria bacterium]
MVQEYALLAGLCGMGVMVGAGASFTGLGGGFLMVPLLLALGYSPQEAVGTSFVAILMIACSALMAHSRGGEAGIDFRAGILLGLGGIIGAQFGARFLGEVSALSFKKIFACVLFAIAIWMLGKK